jgi:flagellin
MSAVLNTNVASLWASKNLLGAQNKMADSVERLSSGLRINRARDDAAGLGVANALTSQINSANQGVRNLNDGISMVQTAEASIIAASDMGQRILTLATQGANATLGLDERKAIQAEMSKLLNAIDSIGGRTKFSGNPLLGVGTGETATDTKYSLQISREISDKVNLTNDAFRNVGFGSAAVTESAVFNLPSALTDGQSITIAGLTVKAEGGTATVANVIAAFVTGTAAVNNTDTDITVTGVRGNWNFTSAAAGTLTATSSTANSAVADLASPTFVGGILATQTSYTQGGSASNGQASTLKTNVDALGTLLETGTDLPGITTKFNDIQTAAQAYVVALGTQRSTLGAFQNQIEYTVNNVTDLSANLSAARSRVQDTDYAAETASLTKGQILQQAATAMLAQANQMPNVILTLLK